MMIPLSQSLTSHTFSPILPTSLSPKLPSLSLSPKRTHLHIYPHRRTSQFRPLICSVSVASEPKSSQSPTYHKPFPAEVSRTVMELSSVGTLSTLTRDGWPIGIGVRFAVDAEGTPVLSLNSSNRQFSIDTRSTLHVQLNQSGLRTPQCTIQGSLDKPEDGMTLKMAPGGRQGRLPATSNMQNSLASGLDVPPTQATLYVNGQAAGAKKRGRGPTIGLGLEKLNRGHGKLPIIIDEEKGRPLCGVQAAKLSSEIGIISRKFLQPPTSWKKINESAFTTTCDRLKERFDINVDEPHVMKSCVNQLKMRVKSQRHKLHKKFLEFNSEAVARENPPIGVDAVHWNGLVDMWTSEKWKARSAQNKENRKKVLTINRMGSKCLEVAREELRNMVTHEEEDPIDFYKRLYYSEAKGWRSERTKLNHDKMVEMKSKPVEEGQQPLSSAEIVEEVLGRRSKFTLSLGCRTNESSSMASRNAVLESELEAHKRQMAEMMDQMRDMAARQKVYDHFFSRIAPPNTPSPSTD